MSLLALSFESKEDSLSVRRFSVHEAMSSLFGISIWARSPNDDIDLETIVGKPASFRVATSMKFDVGGMRIWNGICSHMELLHAEPPRVYAKAMGLQAESISLSTYHLRIVPKLWLLTQRVNHRIFQHQSIPEIVQTMLEEWSIDHDWKIDRESYPKLEIRSQYGESDFDFVSRLLEEAGISYYFAEKPADEDSDSKDKLKAFLEKPPATQVIFHDAPQSAEPRVGGPIDYEDNPLQAAEREFVTHVRIAQQVRPGKVTLRDHDFRRSPMFKFFGHKGAGHTLEDLLEHYRYTPGSFLVELDGKEAEKLGALSGAGGGLPGLLGGLGGAGGNIVAQVGQVMGPAGQIMGQAGQMGQAASLPGAIGMGGPSVAGMVEQQVGGAVQAQVGSVVQQGVASVAGAQAGEIIGDIAGGLAGGLVGKAAGKLAGGLLGMLAGGLGRLMGDDQGIARFTEKAGFGHATRQLESARAARRSVTFETNVLDLAPGTVISIGNHPRTDLDKQKKLLVAEFSLEGTHDGEWNMSAQALFADVPYRPPMKTPRPVIQGLQSAVVVGPQGEEIHTDEFGRVRVQFHWDRDGEFDNRSYCWMRVSHGWAGSGFGMIAIPRVGQEVLVAFLEGNPDHPIVVGRLYNNTARVPYDLPANKTKSGWRTDSSPGSGGYNELMFEDAKGRELVYVQAERDLEKLVKRNETISVGNDRTKVVGSDETISVGHDRRTSIGAVDESLIGMRYNVTMRQLEAEGSSDGEGKGSGNGEGKDAGSGDGKGAGNGDGQGSGNGAGKEIGPTFYEMVDRRIHFTTGEASITLDGPNITLEAKGRIFIHSTDDDVEILGGPWVKINCGPVKDGESDTVTSHHITGIVRDQDGKPLVGRKVVVKGSDGAIQQVETDSGGRYFALVPPGKCEVSMPGTRIASNGVNFDTMFVDPLEFDDSGSVA